MPELVLLVPAYANSYLKPATALPAPTYQADEY
jgi:hypothetical protein